MNEFLFLAPLIVALASTFMIWQYRVLSLAQVSAIQVLFLTHVLAQFVPAMVFATNGSEISARFLMHNAIAAFMIPLGAVLADMVGRRGSINFYTMPFAERPGIRRSFSKYFLGLFGFCLLIFITYVLQAPSIPAYDLLFSANVDFTEHAAARREVSSMGRIYGIAQRFLMPLLFLLCFIGIRTFRLRSLRMTAWYGIVMVLLYQAWPGSKTPVAALFVAVGFLILLRRSEFSSQAATVQQSPAEKRRMRKKRKRIYLGIIVLMTIVIGYPTLIYMNKPVGQLGLGYVLEQVFMRIFFKPAENSYLTYVYFSGHEFTYFRDVSALSFLMGWDYFNLSQTIAVFRGFGGLTNSPPAAVGAFYAQGGLTVVLLGVPFAAFLFRLYEHMCRNTVKTPLSVALYALLIYGAFRFSWANFHTLLMTELFVPLTIMFVFAKGMGTGRAGNDQRIGASNRAAGVPMG